MSDKKYFLLLILLIAFHVAVNYCWLREGICLYGKDVGLRILVQERFYNELKEIIRSDFHWENTPKRIMGLFRIKREPAINVWTANERLVPCIYAVIAAIFGMKPLVILMAGSLFLAILLIAMFYLGRYYAGAAGGLLAATIVSFYPFIYGLSRKYSLDLPMLACICGSLAILVYNQSFSHRWHSLLFGVFFGLGMLVKENYPIFVMGPLLFTVGAAFKFHYLRGSLGKVFLPNFLVALGAAVAVSAIWWCDPNYKYLWQAWIIKHATVRDYDILSRWGLPDWLFYSSYTIEYISPLFAYLGCFTSYLFLTRQKQNRGFIIAWLVVPYVVLSLCRSKWGSFYFGSLPAIAIMTAQGMLLLRKKMVRMIVISGSLGLAFIQFLGLSFGIGGLDNTLRLFGYNEDWYRRELQQTAQYHAWYHPPWKNNYQEVMNEFSGLMRPQEYLRVGIVESRENWHSEDAYILEYYLRLRHPWCIVYESVSMPQAFFNKYRCADYFIVFAPEGEARPVRSDYPSISDQAFDEMSTVLKGCELLKTATLQPKNFSAALYRRRPLMVRGNTMIPADSFCQGNLFVSHPYVGSDPAVGGPLSGEECDSPFPTRVWEKPPGEPFYVMYELFFEKGGTFRLRIGGQDSVQYPGPTWLFDDMIVEQGADFEVSAGPHRLRLESFAQIRAFTSVVLELAAHD